MLQESASLLASNSVQEVKKEAAHFGIASFLGDSGEEAQLRGLGGKIPLWMGLYNGEGDIEGEKIPYQLYLYLA